MSDLQVPAVPGMEQPAAPRRRQPERRPATQPRSRSPRRQRTPRRRVGLGHRLSSARAALGRLWGPALGNTTMRKIVLPAALTGFVLASIAIGAGTAAPAPETHPTGAVPPGNVTRWIADAVQVLEANGTPASALDTADIALIIRGESGGNPRAINLTDSNAIAGHPSKGLMQCIDSTFQSNKLPGHDDIYNPVDSIIAGVRYAIHRYGSLDAVPGVASVHRGGPYIGY